MAMREHEVEVLDDDVAEFEALGRRAGAELRQSPPAGARLAAVRAARRHRRITAGAAGAGVLLAVAIVGAGLLLGDETDEPTPATVPPTVVDRAPVEPVALTLAHDGPLDGLVIAPDGSLAVTLAASDGPAPYVLTGWDLRTGAQRFAVAQSSNSGPVLGVSADGATFAVRTNPDVERFLSTADGSPAERADVTWSEPFLPVVSPDGRFRVELDATSADRSVRLVGPDLSGGVEVARLSDDEAVTAAFSGDGSLVAVLDGTSVTVWRTTDPARVAGFALPAEAGVLGHLEMDRTGSIVAVTAGDMLLVRPIPPTMEPVLPRGDTPVPPPSDLVLRHEPFVTAFAFSPDSRFVATSASPRPAEPTCTRDDCAQVVEVALWDTARGTEVWSVELEGRWDGADLAFAVDSNVLCLGSGSAVQCVGPRSGELVAPPAELSPPTDQADARHPRLTSSDGRWAASVSSTGDGRVLRIDGEATHVLVRPPLGTTARLVFNGDGSLVAARTSVEVVVWELEPFGEARRVELPDWTSTAEVIAFSPDGRLLGFTLEDSVYLLHLGGAS
jgi:WD40 repeat protein